MDDNTQKGRAWDVSRVPLSFVFVWAETSVWGKNPQCIRGENTEISRSLLESYLCMICV